MIVVPPLSVSLFTSCFFLLEIVQCTEKMLSVWICNDKARDKMAFLFLCVLGSLEQLVARGSILSMVVSVNHMLK